ncbi:hypothetical protein [Methylobacterium trifolii]|uniref:Uncharacterized protein n=1 Tax=Methylobacterium trifolii TaxID=1003092 RepID=A0ABQ4TYZ3_9HYPH|nr:hypothetical protein [Methylobacterium trifolii]GJE59751.1 hypothetical protein MPOCJGCO_1853 [Methylobacterium trifolii]
MAYSEVRDPVTGAARDDVVRRESDGAFIPADPGNTDWLAYRAWIAAGNAPAAGRDPTGDAPPGTP